MVWPTCRQHRAQVLAPDTVPMDLVRGHHAEPEVAVSGEHGITVPEAAKNSPPPSEAVVGPWRRRPARPCGAVTAASTT